jgi:Fic family protein
MAYVYSEQDDCDLTYFLHYNIQKLKLARQSFQEYIYDKVRENRLLMQYNDSQHDLNERQNKLLYSFYQDMENHTNIKSYQLFYSVKKGTAIADLKSLVEQGLLVKKKQGRNTYYYPTKAIYHLFNG